VPYCQAISTIDAQGVAAIQGLYETVQADNADLQTQIDALQAENADLTTRIERLEAVIMGGTSAGVSPWAFLIFIVGGGFAGVVVLQRKGHQ